MFVAREVDPQLRRETVLGPDEERVVGLLVELLLAERKEPRLALQVGAERRRRRRAAGRRDPCWEHVLRDFVDDQEERRAGAAEAAACRESPRPLPLGTRARACVPARLVYQLIGSVYFSGNIIDITSEKSSSASCLSFASAQGCPSVSCADLLESCPLAVPLELELEVGDERLGAAVAEPPLDLPHGRRVNVLVVSRDAADIEHNGERVDLLPQLPPGVAKFRRPWGRVAAKQGLGERRAVGQCDSVEREAEQLGEARFA